MTRKTTGRGGGRSNPPTEHQWRRGQSGNPKGRPKKAAAEPLDEDVAAMILAEGFKTVTLTEGGKPSSMPAIQAVTRAMLVAGVKGNSHAQRNFVQLVANAEAQQQKRKEEAITAALGLKIELEALRGKWLALGRDEADTPVHPSDVEIDVANGSVRHFLAFTEEQHKARGKLVELRDYLLGQIAKSLAVAAEDGDDQILEMSRDAARAAVVRINRKLPSRLRRVPPGDEPSVSAESSPEEVWRAMMQPITDLLINRLRS